VPERYKLRTRRVKPRRVRSAAEATSTNISGLAELLLDDVDPPARYSPAMTPYRPTLTYLPGGVAEQSFHANVVHVDDELVAFGDLLPDDERGLPHGTPVHSLLVHLGEDGPEAIEFNDQGNTVDVDAVQEFDLARGYARLSFRGGAGPFAGRVSLAPEIEVFEDAWLDPVAADGGAVQLGAICVHFEVSDARFEMLRTKLALPGGI
jgi:hypothetical protein